MISAGTTLYSARAHGLHCYALQQAIVVSCIAVRLMLTSPPMKSQASRLLLPMVHVRPASTGVLSSFRSFPANRGAHHTRMSLHAKQPM